MITTGILTAFLAVLSWLAHLMPPLTLPGWVSTVHDTLTTAADSAGELGNLVPLGAVIGGATFVLSCYTLAFTIRLVRWVQSTVTGGGGV